MNRYIDSENIIEVIVKATVERVEVNRRSNSGPYTRDKIYKINKLFHTLIDELQQEKKDNPDTYDESYLEIKNRVDTFLRSCGGHAIYNIRINKSNEKT